MCGACLHASRSPQSGSGTCVWERWRETGKAEGTRVRDGLRNGVEKALLTLGEGFLQHPANEALRIALHDGTLSKDAYFQQLLRLVYRLIFGLPPWKSGACSTRRMTPKKPWPRGRPMQKATP